MSELKAVVLDDMYTIRRLVRLTLEKRRPPPTIYEGSDGKQGLALIKEHNPAIVFVDYQMPAMNGGQFLERAREQNFEGVIIVLTAEEKRVVEELLRTYDARYLRKPSDMKDEKVAAAFEKIVHQYTDGAAGRLLRRGHSFRSAV